jgi:hypothetical protein
MTKRCDQCGKSAGTVQETWTCDPGGGPIMAWLHRECEAAFLQRLDDEQRWEAIFTKQPKTTKETEQ